MARTTAVRLGALLLLSCVVFAPARAAGADAGAPHSRGEVLPFTLPGPRLFNRQTQSRISDRLSPLRFGSRREAVREAANARGMAAPEPEPEARPVSPEPRGVGTRAAVGRVQAFDVGEDLTVLSNRGNDQPVHASAPRSAPVPRERPKPPPARQPVAQKLAALPPLVAAADLERPGPRVDRARREQESSTLGSLLPKLAIAALLLAGGLWLAIKNAT